MGKLWRDLWAHKRAAALFLLYWLATVAVVVVTWEPGGMANGALVLLLTTPLIAGALVGWWRGTMPEPAHRWRDQITGGMLAGLLTLVITLVGSIIKDLSGVVRDFGSQGGEILEWFIASGVVGAVLGSVGAALAMALGRVGHHGGRLRPHHGS